jgi:hypothetical protein
MCHRVNEHPEEPHEGNFMRGFRWGTLLSVPLWGAIIIGIINIAGAIHHGR